MDYLGVSQRGPAPRHALKSLNTFHAHADEAGDWEIAMVAQTGGVLANVGRMVSPPDRMVMGE